MSRSTAARSLALSKKSTEIAIAAPQVVAHRMTRMALSGLNPSMRDQKEFSGMVQEKQVAFAQSWVAMWAASLQMQQRMLMSMWGGMMTPWALPSTRSLSHFQRQAERGAFSIMDKGLAPIHRKAVSNSKRLAKTSLF